MAISSVRKKPLLRHRTRFFLILTMTLHKKAIIFLSLIAGVAVVGGVMAAQTDSFGTRIDACIASNQSSYRYQDHYGRAGLGRLLLLRNCFWVVYQQEIRDWQSQNYPRFSSSSMSSVGSSMSSSMSSTVSSSLGSSSVSSGSSTSSQSSTGSLMHEVSLKDNKYNPSIVTMKLNETIRWKNNESNFVPHTVSRTSGISGPSNQLLRPGQYFDYRFTQTGSYIYHCAIHPTMTGAVIVTK